MRRIHLLIALFISSFGLSQDLPKNAQAGKCYVKCLDYDLPITWQETSCDSLNKNEPKLFIKGEEAVSYIKRKTKFIKYQEQLIKLGYNLEVSGFIDEKTEIAHNSYLRDKRKAIKRDERIKKRRLKDSLKNTKS